MFCRYSESPTSELESRTSKGRAAKRGGRGNSGTPVETETRKNLRSSKSKSKSNLNSPAKRKGRGSDGDEKSGDEKRKRTDSSRNSPDDDEDSEKDPNQGGNESDKDSATSSVKGKEDEGDFMPKDKEEEKYIPPPPLPYALVCPKNDCKKRYRQHNGLRFHVSHAHPELLDESGNIRDTSEIERLEKEAKERLKTEDTKNGKETSGTGAENSSENSSNSGSSSKTSTPGPSDSSQPADLSTSQPISVPLPPTLKGPPLDAKPIPVSEMGGIPSNARPPPPVLQTTTAALPLVARGPTGPPTAAKPIRPPVNARPIVPATGPQIMPAGIGAGPLNLKPIQPRPTIMPDPTPALALDDLKKAKKQKKISSPGNSPPRNNAAGTNGNSPKIPKLDNQKSENPVPAKSPYSDISDDENNDKKKAANQNSGAGSNPGPVGPLAVPPVVPQIPAGAGPPVPTAPFPFNLPSSATLPTVPISPQQPKEKKENPIAGPQPGTTEYEKMLLAYGFPPFPYPIPQGMDPNMHVQMLSTDPVYRAKYEKDRIEKEKAFKEQIDRDNREKDRKAGVKLPPEDKTPATPHAPPAPAEHMDKPKPFSSPMISVKPEFRTQNPEPKKELKSEPPVKKPEDEGIKATMETRGPPPATPTSFASLMHPSLMGRSPFPYDQALLASLPPHIIASLYGPAAAQAAQAAAAAGASPYMPHGLGGMRPPFGGPASNPDDVSRQAALAMAALTSSGSSATKALDLLQQHANQYYAAVAASASGSTAVTTTSSSSSPSSHKIHELSERALKSPVTSRPGGSSPSVHRVTPTSTMASTLGKSSDLSKRTPSPARTTTPTGSRSRSPPPLRHVHTHTHTHFGLGYPLLPPHPSGVPGVAPPAAHTPFPPAGFPSK